MSQRIQDFILERELAEVYLLLDHMSGRSDKSLTEALGSFQDGKDLVKNICQIGWPANATPLEQAVQAGTLIVARDLLNILARPANGASIAYTLLVTGDAGPVGDNAQKKRKWPFAFNFRSAVSNSASAVSREDVQSGNPTAPLIAESSAVQDAGPSDESALAKSAPGVAPSAFGDIPPSRYSLASRAYPGFVRKATFFKWVMNFILLFLLIWLAFTCMLSWNITAGKGILAQLATFETERIAITKDITNAETLPEGSSTTAPSTPAKYIRYCDRARSLQKINGFSQFESAPQQQLCDRLEHNLEDIKSVNATLSDWLTNWVWVRRISYWFCGSICEVEGDTKFVLPAGPSSVQWAQILLDVLANSVLPLFYGLLGAGAAIVRSIWSKMSNSLLLHRDLILSLGQLSLGAIIGACIGLFIAPSVGTVGFAGTTLSASALSFIGGFGVEGVFSALEGLLKRIFNMPEHKS